MTFLQPDRMNAGLLIRYARRVRSELAQLRGFGPADYAGTWQPGWPAAVYLKQLKALLQRRGWRVLGGQALGADRIMLMVHKDRFTAPVLLVRPGAAVTPQDLTQLVGIGPKLSIALAERGVTRFEHIAAWKAKDVAKFDAELSLKGRAVRAAWVAQAQRLAKDSG